MNIVNESIITVADLHNVDTYILETQKRIEEKQNYAQASLDTSALDEKTALMVSDLIEQLSSTNLTSESIQQLQLKYPKIQVLDTMDRLVSEKQQVSSDRAYLAAAETIEDAIHQLDLELVSKYQAIFSQISALEPKGVSKELLLLVNIQLVEQSNAKVIILKNRLLEQLNGLVGEKDLFTAQPPSNEELTKINDLTASLISLQAINHRPTYPDTWWAIDALLKFYMIRFDFHFSGKKATNKLLKPEWCFGFVEEFLAKSSKLFELLLNQAFRPLKLIMLHQVITSTLVPLRVKILQILTVLNEKIEEFKDANDAVNHDKTGRLLSHLVFELTSFDQRIRNKYKYNPFVETVDRAPTKKWMGITADVLLQGDKERIGTTNWLSFESILASNRFKSEIIEDPSALVIDTDYKANKEEETEDAEEDETEPTDTLLKPTYSALNLVKLFNNLTNHYRTMRMVKFQLKYVSTIQLKLIEDYYDYLGQTLRRFDDTYNSLNVLNLIPGGMDTSSANESKVSESMKGLELLTQVFCSAQFILNHLEKWGEELIFIQLWNAFKTVAHKEYSKQSNIFDSSVEQYSRLIKDIRDRYRSFFQKGIKNYLKDYINTSQWEIHETKDNTLQFASLITHLPIYLNYLQRTMIPVDYFIVANAVLVSICNLWYEYIITNNKFTKKGVAQLEQDFGTITSRLGEELLIGPHNKYSTNANYSYQKIIQSIDLLNKYDPVLAKRLAQNSAFSTIRADFEHNLANLRDDDITDILYRIA